MRLIAPICCTLVAASASAQYSGPESVEYDPVGDRYFVSNTGSGQIVVRQQDGSTATFTTVSPAPYGLEIMGDVLYACSGGGVKGYALSDGSLVFNRSLGGGFANGITTDGTHLYVTDFSGKRILKVDPVANDHEVLVANTVNTPNGIVYDPVLGHLWVAGWGANAMITAFDRADGSLIDSHTTSLGSIDGITLDCNGMVLVASWSPNRLSRFDPATWAAPTVVLNTGLASPADIDYDMVNDRVCIPNSGNNTVVLHPYGCSTGMTELPASTMILAPNPAGEHVRITGDALVGRTCIVRDMQGRVARTGRLDPSGVLGLDGLQPGAYFVEMEGHAPARLVKE